MYSDELKSEALELIETEVNGRRPSLREVSRQLDISIGTLSGWAKEAKLDLRTADVVSPTNGVSTLMVKKVRKMLGGIELLDPKAQLDRAGAIEKLVSSSMKLSGTEKPEAPVNNTQVNVLLSDLLREG